MRENLSSVSFASKGATAILLSLLLGVIIVITSEASTTRAVNIAALLSEPKDIRTVERIEGITTHQGKVWHWSRLFCQPGRTVSSVTNTVHSEISWVTIDGVSSYTVFEEVTPGGCKTTVDLASNVLVDDAYAYWMSTVQGGLVRRSGAGKIERIYSGQSTATEITQTDNHIYLMDRDYGIIRVEKDSGDIIRSLSNEAIIVPVGELGDGSLSDLQVTDRLVLWRSGTTLNAKPLGNGSRFDLSNVSTYAAKVCNGGCQFEDIYVGRGNQVWRYRTGEAPVEVYTSDLPDAVISELILDDDNIYIDERRASNDDAFSTFLILRIDQSGGDPAVIYQQDEKSDPISLGDNRVNLNLLSAYSKKWLVWHEGGTIYRLPRNAKGIELVDISVTHVEVTQAVQNLENEVDLVQGKRTGVRVHVKADGADVPGVKASLYRIDPVNGQILAGPLWAENGPIAVQNSPDRTNFDHAFYFELPLNWVEDETLRLRTIVNPGEFPPEPHYTNNSLSTKPFDLLPAPSLYGNLFLWPYTYSGKEYTPEWGDPDSPADVDQVEDQISWLRRAFPISSYPEQQLLPPPGIRMQQRTIVDDAYDQYADQTDPFCNTDSFEDLIPGSDKPKEFCAAYYMNREIEKIRAIEGAAPGELFYGMTWEAKGIDKVLNMRGYARNGVASGMTGEKPSYMAHELGHNIGVGHPDENSDDPETEDVQEGCKHNAQDPFPHADAHIGSNTTFGFNLGDTGLDPNQTPEIYSNEIWHDFMSYCSNLWISDHNYKKLYDLLTESNGFEIPAARQSDTPVEAGDAYLYVQGAMTQAFDRAVIDGAMTWATPGMFSTPSGSMFTARFVDQDGDSLAEYGFDLDQHAASDINGFALVLPLHVEAAAVEIVSQRNGSVIGQHPISANPPSVSNVTVELSSTNQVEISWEGSDPDPDDSLTYAVHYSADGGATYQVYATSLSRTEVTLDGAQLAGGGRGHFRVWASDGARTGQGVSDLILMPFQAPSITFLSPSEGQRVQYDTQVHVMANVNTVQSGEPITIEWLINGVLSSESGLYFSTQELPIGSNEITLRISQGGERASQTVTVNVHGEFGDREPSLSIGPQRLGWQLDEVGQAPSPFEVSITNLGFGDLNWTASTTADWLTLRPIDQTRLSVEADITSLGPDEIHSTQLSIETESGQLYAIPVSLLRGGDPAWVTIPPASPVGEPNQDENSLFIPMILDATSPVRFMPAD